MGVIKNILKGLGLTKKSESVTGSYLPYGGNFRYYFGGLESYGYNERNSQEFLRNGFGRNPHVYAVVKKISNNFSTLPKTWIDPATGAYIDKMDASLIEANSIIETPNWKESKEDFQFAVLAQLLITGNAICYPGRAVGFSGISSINVAPSSDVVIETDTGGLEGKPTKYTINAVGEFSANEILHLRMPNPLRNTYWGLSPLFAGQAVYTGGNNTFEAAASIHNNRGRTGVIFPKNSEMPMLPSVQEEAQKNWEKRTTGPNKFGGVHLSPIEMGYINMGLSPSDLKLIESLNLNLRDICRIYGLPSQMMDDPQSKTYNNYNTALISFYKNVLLPLSLKVDKALGKYLLTQVGAKNPNMAYYCVDKSQVEELNAVNTEQSQKVISEVRAGIITAEEAKDILYPEL